MALPEGTSVTVEVTVQPYLLNLILLAMKIPYKRLLSTGEMDEDLFTDFDEAVGNV
jgi:hypothetical protein